MAAILPILPPLKIAMNQSITYAKYQFLTFVIKGKNLSNSGLEIVWFKKVKIDKSILYRMSCISKLKFVFFFFDNYLKCILGFNNYLIREYSEKNVLVIHYFYNINYVYKKYLGYL